LKILTHGHYYQHRQWTTKIPVFKMGCGGSKSQKNGKESKALPRQSTPGRPMLYIWPGSAPCRATYMAARAAAVDVQLCSLDVFKEEHKSEEFKKVI
jgi:hypothetical protein